MIFQCERKTRVKDDSRLFGQAVECMELPLIEVRRTGFGFEQFEMPIFFSKWYSWTV